MKLNETHPCLAMTEERVNFPNESQKILIVITRPEAIPLIESLLLPHEANYLV